MVWARPDLRNLDFAVAKVLGCVVTDSRHAYDKLVTEVVSIKGAERRGNLEQGIPSLYIRSSEMGPQRGAAR